MKIIIDPHFFKVSNPGVVSALLVLDPPGEEKTAEVDGVNFPAVEILVGKISQDEVMDLPRGAVVKRVAFNMTWGV